MLVAECARTPRSDLRQVRVSIGWRYSKVRLGSSSLFGVRPHEIQVLICRPIGRDPGLLTYSGACKRRSFRMLIE